MSVTINNRIGFGTMGLTWTGNPPPQEQSFELIKAAIESGVDLIVSGEFYGIEPKEANLILLQDFFKKYPELRSKVKISVKGGVNMDTLAPDGSKENVTKSINNILKYLDFIDLFECARVDPNVPIEDTVSYIKEFVDLGKVGGISLSEVSAATIKKAVAVHPISAVEIEFSLWSQDALKNGVYDLCQELKIPIFAYSPLGRGFLTGAFKSFEDTKNLTDFRAHLDRFTDRETFEHNLAIVKKIEEIAARKKAEPSQIALAWIIKHKGIIPIPGTSKASRVKQNLASVDIDFTDDDFKEINDFFETFQAKGLRYNAQMEHQLSV